MAKKITTLYIDDNSIRLMVTRGKRISKLAEASLDMNLAEISSKVRDAEIVAKIKHLLKVNKVSDKKVIIGLSGLQCLSRPAALPQLPRAMLSEAVMREAQRVLPVSMDQLYISWQVMSTTEGKMQVFMEAIPRQVADNLLTLMHQVGLKPVKMDIKPLALTRLVREGTAIMVDVQPKEFDVVIMTDGVPQPIRTIPFSTDTLSTASDRLVVIRDEVRRTVEFFNANAPENTIKPDVTMYVSGELAAEPEMCDLLANELGYQVTPLTSPLKCPKHLDAAPYLVNIGLALKDLPKEAGPLRPNVNALPLPYQPKQISMGKLVSLPAVVIACGLIALLAMTIQEAAASIDSVSSRLDTTNQIIETRHSQKDELTESIASLKKELASTESKRQQFINIRTGLDTKGDKIDGDLQASVNNLLADLTLATISHSGTSLNLNGGAASEAEVLEYARKLVASGRFIEVTVSNIRLTGDVEGEEGEGEEEGSGTSTGTNGPVQFSLKLKLKGA